MKILNVSSIKFKPINNGDQRKLTDDFEISVKVKGAIYTINILSGFIWDGASVPAFLRYWKTKWAKCSMEAALVHDALYSSGKTSRKFADKLFKNMLECSCWDKFLYYSGVRLFGWTSYNDCYTVDRHILKIDATFDS